MDYSDYFVPHKVYADDLYVRLAACRLGARIDSLAAFHEMMQYSFLIMRPDALGLNCEGEIEAFLDAKGYTTVCKWSLVMNFSLVEAIWRYQWNRLSAERIQLNLHALTSGPCRLLLLKRGADSSGRRMDVDTSLALSRDKGATKPAARQPGTLRAKLGGDSKIQKYIHAPDSFADFLREGEIFSRHLDVDVLGATMDHFQACAANFGEGSNDEREYELLRRAITSVSGVLDEQALREAINFKGCGSDPVYWGRLRGLERRIQHTLPGRRPIVDAINAIY